MKNHQSGSVGKNERGSKTPGNANVLYLASRSRGAIPDFEQAIVGMQVGEDKTVLIPAEQAYGMHRPDMVVTTPRQNIPENIQPEVGQRLQIQTAGQPAIGVTIVEVTDLHVLLDANHPLAGKNLTFDIILAAVVGMPQDE